MGFKGNPRLLSRHIAFGCVDLESAWLSKSASGLCGEHTSVSNPEEHEVSDILQYQAPLASSNEDIPDKHQPIYKFFKMNVWKTTASILFLLVH